MCDAAPSVFVSALVIVEQKSWILNYIGSCAVSQTARTISSAAFSGSKTAQCFDFFAGWVDARGLRFRYCEPRDPRAILKIPFAGILAPHRIANKALLVPPEIGMKCETINGFHLKWFRHHIQSLQLFT